MKNILNSPGKMFTIMLIIGALAVMILLIKDTKNHKTTPTPDFGEVFYSKVCVDGIQYLHFLNAAVAQIDANGKPITCAK